ncbi:YraN family protein [Radicibacter daui]|uniref:YraN family protein n=1 Tax=Radicibacter daui TaxID=3064829 RepID=UPI004046FB35
MTAGGAPARQQAERVGRRAEQMAAWWLRLKGYRLVASRIRTPFGEMDLVARRGAIVIIVEVKYRRRHETGLEAILPFQQQRIARAALWWLSRRGLDPTLALRFDVVTIVPWRLPRHLADAWRP